MPIRNPFKRSGASEVSIPAVAGDRGFSNASVAGSQPIDDQEPLEYQLSEINDSGVFLPPSPEHYKGSFWHTKSNTSTNHRNILGGDNEPFNMSRESFDSFRRSFDISARSPVTSASESDSRHSFDFSLMLPSPSPQPRTSVADRYKGDWPEDEELEDVKLADDQQRQPPVPRRRGLFARFAETSERSAAAASGAKEQELGIKPGHSFQLFSGRKRGYSGQGDELKSMSRAGTPTISAGGSKLIPSSNS